MKNTMNKLMNLFTTKNKNENQTVTGYYEQINKSHFEVGKFYPMTTLPPRDGNEDLSIWVIVYDENDSGYYNLGYYDYEAQEWNAVTEEPMHLKCWCFAPDPSPYWNGKEFKSIFCP